MNNPTSIRDIAAAEAALAAAGITTAVVASCDDEACGWCHTVALPAAA